MKSTRRSARAHAVLVLSLAIALTITACARESQEPPPASSSTQAPTASERPWNRFTSDRISYSFETPGDWKVVDISQKQGQPAESFSFEIQDPTGVARLRLTSGSYVSFGNCLGAEAFVVQELDSAPTVVQSDGANPAPRFVYRVGQVGGEVISVLAVTSSAVTDRSDCIHAIGGIGSNNQDSFSFGESTVIGYHPGMELRYRTFKTMDEAKAYTTTDEFKTLRRILTSLQAR